MPWSVKKVVKKTVALLLTGVMLAACGATPHESGAGGARKGVPPNSDSNSGERTIEIYAGVIRRLVTKDHTFGGSSSPFEHVYVVDGAVEDAGNPMEGDGEPGAPFSDEVKGGLKEELGGLPPIDFVSDPDSVRLGTDKMEGVKNEGVIITLSPIARDGDRVEVPNSLWCGGLCGQWLTYVVELKGDGWEVTGTTGPSAIS